MGEVSRSRVPSLPRAEAAQTIRRDAGGLVTRVERLEALLGGRSSSPEAVVIGRTGQHPRFDRGDPAYRDGRGRQPGLEGGPAVGTAERAEPSSPAEPEAVEQLLRELRSLAREQPEAAERLLARHPVLAARLRRALDGGGLDARAWSGRPGPGLY